MRQATLYKRLLSVSLGLSLTACASAPLQLKPKPATVASVKQTTLFGLQSLKAMSKKVDATLTDKTEIQQHLTKIYYTINRYKDTVGQQDVGTTLKLGAEYYKELADLKRSLKQLQNHLHEIKNAQTEIERYYTIMVVSPAKPGASPVPSASPTDDTKPPLPVPPTLFETFDDKNPLLGENPVPLEEPILKEIKDDTAKIPSLNLAPEVVEVLIQEVAPPIPVPSPLEPTPPSPELTQVIATLTPLPPEAPPDTPPPFPASETFTQLETVSQELEQVTTAQEKIAEEQSGIKPEDIPPVFELILTDKVELEVGAAADLYLKTTGTIPAQETITWENADPTIYEIQGSGSQIRLIGLKVGTADIRVKVGTSQKSATVIVSKAVVLATPTPIPTATPTPSSTPVPTPRPIPTQVSNKFKQF